ncbi:sulfotransferase family protein [Dickeya dianthicola]|uniref:sulfotransferase family 2 domain-containing protein n=1 Tax=Dickeya dianthicola TaxID=204039 RepID=UPI00136A2AC2|nr:sulfotransferase family 2 domain-containing protein [Dickeya dianthicola]MCI4238431.1 sulfotransferase family 2 domain-containing protein [Dickeya dianthicola]MCI4256321.1 sulfotransferase family 2 domain-containing protein [Dickeya dianthicola]MZG20556.1 sulfotransferase family protein [Dickeya dianthicola]MZI88651.1 sulfotransferase family protein [Dickeya dianthicola]
MPRIVFHHINKCAGTSLLKYLQNFFPSDECMYLEEHANWMSIGDIALDPNRLARARFIHDPFGSWFWPEKVSNVATMCFLRDPLDKVVSNWWMVHRWTDKEVAIIPDGKLIRDLARNDPVAFFSHPQSQYINWNQITCHLACAPHEYREAWRTDSLNSADFRAFIRQRAEKTLRSLSFIGFQEDFGRSLSALQLWLSLPPDQPQPMNIHASKQQKPSLSEEAIAAANQLVDLDREIVAIARELYDEQMERFEATYGVDFASAAEDNYRKALIRPAGWTVVDMSQPLNGTGWHCRERNESKFSRWIGPTPTATIDIPFRKDRDILVRFRVTNILSTRQADELTLKVDGYAATLHRWSESTFVVVFDAVIPQQELNHANGILHLTIDCAETITMTAPGDGRQLGLEICEIEVGPSDAFILQSPGTPAISLGLRGIASSRND